MDSYSNCNLEILSNLEGDFKYIGIRWVLVLVLLFDKPFCK